MLEDQIFDRLISGLEAAPERASITLEEIVSYPELLASEDFIEDTTRQRENGIFYTSFFLARIMIAEAFASSEQQQGSFFEPCVGGGAFYFAYIDLSMDRTARKEGDLQAIVNRSYIADNDEIALNTLRRVAPRYFKARYGYEIEIPEQNIFFGDSLWCEKHSEIQNFRKIFNQPLGFDFVVTNPPYKLIKGDKRQGKTSTNSLIQTISAIRSEKALSFIQGVPNLYKLFVEAITCHWVSDQGTVGLLIPKSLLGDSQSSDLREHLLDNFKLGSIFSIPEGSNHFKGVGQAFSMFVATKGAPTSSIVFADIPESEDVPISRTQPVGIEIIRKYASESGQKLLTHLENFPTFGSFPGIVNLRGEFDMSLDVNFFSDTDQGLSLIQGSSLGHYSVFRSKKYVDPGFLMRPKGRWVTQNRIACQQISNMNQDRRMKWSLIEPGMVLGNSCNFIGIDSDGLWAVPEETIYYFLAILNSSLINERFKLLSPNNHVSNGEINSLPIGDMKAPEVATMIEMGKELTEGFSSTVFEKLDKLVLTHFNFSEDDRYWEVH